MKTNGKFTVLELWREKGFKYNHSLLMIVGVNIARSYRTRYQTDPEIIEVYESESKRKYKVSQYPDKFKKEANKALNRLQKKYPGYLMVTLKKKRTRIKAGI
ncbi:unnamed protein product [marine sediment metagenome]|uniref:Uncharacterized protein n=1 Tax=marine sediment metagenome TaxID=412755 RepID=X1M7B0_9ZZZZ